MSYKKVIKIKEWDPKGPTLLFYNYFIKPAFLRVWNAPFFAIVRIA